MALGRGIYQPPGVDVHLSGTVFNYSPVTATIYNIQLLAGSAIGSAVIRYPAKYAQNATIQAGRAARLTIDRRTVFRGVVGDGPFDISANSDHVDLVLYDDKWRMRANTIGQVGIGTQGSPVGDDGFKDVGFDIVFNRDGMPNKDSASLEFNTGSSAVFWTLQNVMEWIFQYYIDSDVAQIPGSMSWGTGYARIPSHLSLVRLDALQAVNQVAELAGESWGLLPGVSYSTFTRVHSNPSTERRVAMFRPKMGAAAGSVSTRHASRCRVGVSIRNCHDVFQAVSSPIVLESTYTNTGADPMLSHESSYKDKEFVARFGVDVSKYSANNLGGNLSSGSKPKKWRQHLVTRISADGSAYITKADIDSNPALAHNERISKPLVWVSHDKTKPAAARLCAGGFRIDFDNGKIDFRSTINLMNDTEEEPEEITLAAWASAGVWLTVATVLETPQNEETDNANQYLPQQFYQLIHKPDLVPERRRDSRLPDLSGDNNAYTTISSGSEEKYIDVTERLEAARDAAAETAPAIESPIEVGFPFMPELNIGEKLSVQGRTTGATGSEVVTKITYTFADGTPNEVAVHATNVLSSVNEEQFVEQ